MAFVTKVLIDAGQSSAGGWSREQLAILGVAWPPRRGWRRRCHGKEIPNSEAVRFCELKNAHLTRQEEEHRDE